MEKSKLTLLNRIQGQLKVPKSQYNSFSKFHYRNAEDILEAVKPLLEDGELVVFDEIVLIGERYYVKATAELTHGEIVRRSFAFAREASEKKGMDEAQITGAASSYARKYALNGLFLIDDTKDADNSNGESKPEKKSWTVVSKQEPYEPRDEVGSKEAADAAYEAMDEVPIPTDVTEQKKIIMTFVKQLEPKTDMRSAKAIAQVVADYTELALTPKNYPTIIQLLRESGELD